MINKKKIPFWQLSIMFGIMTLIALAISYGYPRVAVSGMMGQSMGSMMRSQHLKNVSISDLLRQNEQQQIMGRQDASSHEVHHEENGGFLRQLHFLTTALIVLLLPLLVAGTIFLSILWI